MRGSVLPYGPEAVLVEVDGLAEAIGVADHIERTAATSGWALDGRVRDIVPGARTVLVSTEPEHLPWLRGWIERMLPTMAAAERRTDPRVEVIRVTYDGPDLAEVAHLTGLTQAAVIEAHTGTPWTVGFAGFTHGFFYLTDGDPRLVVPRRDSPRTSVPGGAVAIAGPYSGVYPRTGPGGWQLIGRTDAVMWEPHPATPTLLRPGMQVRFEVAP